MDNLLGAKLLKGGAEVDTKTAFEGKRAVALFFSMRKSPSPFHPEILADWTAELVQFYKNGLSEKGLEIVLVSCDKDEELFQSHFAELPWLALPYSERELKDSLVKKFRADDSLNCQRAPAVVIFDPQTGEPYRDGRAGRDAIKSDPTGERFPWISLAQLLPETLLKGDDTIEKASIEGKTVGLYFSKKDLWDNDLQMDNPYLILAEWYKKMKPELGDKFEIIFCGAAEQSNMEDVQFHYKEMCEAGGDWLCLPWASRNNLNAIIKPAQLPAFVIVNAEGKIINKKGCERVPSAEAKDFPFDFAIGSLATSMDFTSPDLPAMDRFTPSICLMLEEVDPEVQKTILEKMEPIAKKYQGGWQPEFLFFAATKASYRSGSFRGLWKLCDSKELPKNEATPSIVLMDPADDTYYVARMDADAEKHGSDVDKMIADYKEGKLEKMKLYE